jgi:hypothetical protein
MSTTRSSSDLLEEIGMEVVRRGLLGQPHPSVSLHPATFARVVAHQGIRVENRRIGAMEFVIHTAVGPVVVVSDPDAPSGDSPWYWNTNSPRPAAVASAAGVSPASPDGCHAAARTRGHAIDLSLPDQKPEMVEVYEVARPRLAPVEFIGRLQRDDGVLHVEHATLQVGDSLIARPSDDSPWRTGRAIVGQGLGVGWWDIAAICEGDCIYRIGMPTTPSLEERVEALEMGVRLIDGAP